MEQATDEIIRFHERPTLKCNFEGLFKESLLIQSRGSFQHSEGQWRHGWLYDCCADQEPKITEKKSVMTVSPQPDAPVAKMFFEAALAVSQDNDVFLAPNARVTRL